MKYLLVLLVVAFGLWSLLTRLRGGRGGRVSRGDGAGQGSTPGKGDATLAPPLEMVECAHCGLHLAATDAVAEGSRLYCGDAHRRLGPATPPL